jgi:class 3 adenylate cyclase
VLPTQEAAVQLATEMTTIPTYGTDQMVGILAFMIADIRGYTAFTQAEGDIAAAQLTDYFAQVVRANALEWGGRVVEFRGDEALVVFASLRQSLHAAVTLQEMCVEFTNHHPQFPLRVGIGIDVGEAVAVKESYRGMALNRAARLCSLAQAGEVLVTSGLAYVASRVPGIGFSPQGEAHLKGLATPMNILKVSHDDDGRHQRSA